MSASQPERAVSVSLDQLIALNDEIAALVRVGVPLEEGLALAGKEMPGPHGKLAEWVAERLNRGEPLDQVLAQRPEAFPPIYRSVVQAGLKSGRLAAALEAIATSARRLAQTRRMIAASMIYPLLVFLLAWGLFVFYTAKLASVVLHLAEDLELPGRVFFETLEHWGRSAGYWGPVVPVAVLLAAGLWWHSSGRVSLTDPKAAGVLFGWLPGMRPMLRNFQIAAFADVLGLLVEHRVPLAEAVTLAADAAGARRLKEASGQLAKAIRRGEPLSSNTPGAAALPPLLLWLLSRGQAQDALPAALTHAAEMYHQRALYLAEAARVFTPVIFTLAVGGTVTLLYAMLVLGSWFSILRTFAYPS